MQRKRVFRLVTFSTIFSAIAALIISGVALAAQGITFVPTSNSSAVGSTITVSGTDFSGNVTGNVTFGFGSQFAANVTAATTNGVTNGSGNFSVPVIVPRVPGGLYTIFFSENSSSTANSTNTANFTVLPAVALTPQSGHVGDTISVLGTGFSGNISRTAVISFDATNITSISDNADGSFIKSFVIPAAVGGSHTINANDGITSVNATLTVTAFTTLSSTTGQVGSTTTLTGSGFASTAVVTITFDDTQINQITTDSSGSFNLNINIPESSFGVHTITASDGTGSSSSLFTSTAGITLSASSGVVGSSLTISGKGFVGNALVNITRDGIQIAQPNANTGGSFSVTVLVPSSVGGAHTITATDASSVLSATFTVLSKAAISPTSGKVGSPITLSGSGFGSGTSVGISFDGVVQTTVNADANGSVSATFNIPPGTAGSHTITAADSTFSASSAFTIQPNLALSTDRGTAGAQVTVAGSGFIPNGNVTIQMGSTEVAKVATDAKGSFSGTFSVPQIDAGAYNVQGVDGTNSASATFTVTASFNLSSSQGKAGSTISVTGTGFSGTATIKFDDSAVATATAGANGAFSASFAVPASTRGAHTISVNDATIRLQLPFTVSPDMTIIPSQGNVGSSIEVKGTGFSGTVTVKYDNSEVATATATPNGSFSTTFIAPASLHGPHNITVSDQATSLPATFVMDSTAPPVPALSKPSNGIRQNRQPTLAWGVVDDPSGVTYSLQVAKDAGFTNLVIEKSGLTAAQYKVTESLATASKSAPYRWRVKAVDQAQNESDWSQTRTFYVTRLPPAVVWTFGSILGLVVLAFAVKFAIRFARGRM